MNNRKDTIVTVVENLTYAQLTTAMRIAEFNYVTRDRGVGKSMFTAAGVFFTVGIGSVPLMMNNTRSISGPSDNYNEAYRKSQLKDRFEAARCDDAHQFLFNLLIGEGKVNSEAYKFFLCAALANIDTCGFCNEEEAKEFVCAFFDEVAKKVEVEVSATPKEITFRSFPRPL